MVSFSCENCGDILTKKKLDPHRNQCRGASFTCIDCMVHFQGTEYRSHTSCMTEAQKYEGALYKEKPTKNGRKGKNEPKPNGMQHRAPYVEDVTDVDSPRANGRAPSAHEQKPTAANEHSNKTDSDKPVNVFDFLQPKTPNSASKVSLAEPKGQMRMVDHAPPIFETNKTHAHLDTPGNDKSYEQNGYSYGADPIPQSQYPNQGANPSLEFVTPVPKKKKDRSRKDNVVTSEKKRKRRTEDVDMDDVMPLVDSPMIDAPSSIRNNPGTPMIKHSGLTAGLDRMLRSTSVEGEEQPRRRYEEPASPIKRSKKEKEPKKTRAERLVSSMFGGSVVSSSSADSQPKTIVRHRRRSSSDDGQVPDIKSKKAPKVRNVSDSQMVAPEPKSKRKTSAQTVEGDRPSRQVSGPGAGEMMLYPQANIPTDQQRDMAAHFLSLVTKGPESSRGFSINKILKRFHNDEEGQRPDREQRQEEEKELWRALRLKRNERGEIVVFF
ncbi:hypothetical protein SI65_07209 [Aspergillus cristatus]|uniref:Zinc finger C2H2 LYAR-type domain-containing protein n=1 Tax=Aspergillus cristatus TaxID=573508 RepID=A0A1E3B9D4_ASPCR|nr:hypothetical protein SI65_07209 [Aspergillus cristatus]